MPVDQNAFCSLLLAILFGVEVATVTFLSYNSSLEPIFEVRCSLPSYIPLYFISDWLVPFCLFLDFFLIEGRVYFFRLMGIAVFEQVTKNAVRGLWARRSRLNLVGAHINVFTGEWTQKVTFLLT